MVFRGYDVRGVYPTEINEKIANMIGKALGTFLNRETVSVGVDTRKTSQKILKPFIDGVRSTGCDVIYIGMVPNPVAYYYAFNHRIFGAYITASHNPPEYTGIKFFKPNGVSFTAELPKLKEIYESGRFSEGFGHLDTVEGFEEYKDFVLKHFSGLDGSIAVESFGGAGQLVLPLLESAGLKVTSIRRKIDPKFFGIRPEPTESNLGELKKASKGKNFGVAFDGDADRSVFCDDKGKVLNGSEAAAVFLSYIAKSKARVVLTADSALELEKIVKKKGGKVIWWRVGHGFIEEKLVEEKAIFAAEQSSHFYFNEFYPFSDGILATLYLAKILNGKKLSAFSKLYRIKPIEKFYIDAGDDQTKLKAVEKIRQEMKGIDIMDGVKQILGKNDWVLIRASQTMPEVNVCLQASNRRRLESLKKKYTDYVKKVIEEVKAHG